MIMITKVPFYIGIVPYSWKKKNRKTLIVQGVLQFKATPQLRDNGGGPKLRDAQGGPKLLDTLYFL